MAHRFEPLTPPGPYNRGENDHAEARENCKNPTPAETLLWNKVLRHRQFAKFKFHRQKPIGPYIADIYCPELKLIIEVDGDSHAFDDQCNQKTQRP